MDDREQYHGAVLGAQLREEKRALESFLDIVASAGRASRACTSTTTRRTSVAPARLAARHGVGEEDVDRLLRDGVFVDLYPIVRRALRVGSRSYSIKKLEPLYMGDEVRTSDVQKGDDSIVEYVEARALADDGERRGSADPRRPRGLQPLRLRLDAAAARLARRPRTRGGAAARCARSRAGGVGVPAVRAALSTLASLAREQPDGPSMQTLRLGRGRDRLLPARGQELLGHATSCGCASPCRCGRRRATSLVLDALAAAWSRTGIREEGQRDRAPDVELRGELAPGTQLTEGSSPVRALRAAGAVPVRGVTRAGSTPTIA